MDVRQDYRVQGPVDLGRLPTRAEPDVTEGEAREELARLGSRMRDLQERLRAGREHALLVVLQAMDAGGKDSTIRRVFGSLDPQGCRVESFKAPSRRELAHDYLWRVHAATPARGEIVLFNRSHYEDVLVVRVKELVEEARWRRRYEHIEAFERLLADEGTAIVKLYLHIGKDYQRERFQRRLRRPDKQWKFNPQDLVERERWDAYRAAYEEALSRTSSERAPWYVIPAERRWYRDLVVARIVVSTLEDLGLHYPAADPGLENLEIR